MDNGKIQKNNRIKKENQKILINLRPHNKFNK